MLLVLLLVGGGALVNYLRCDGCIDRDRVNKTCTWEGDARFTFDPQSAAHQRHLVTDAQLAEELGIRFADAEFARRSGGIEHHGGLLDDGQVRQQCLSRMFEAVADCHGASPDFIQRARGVRSRDVDGAVGRVVIPHEVGGVGPTCPGGSTRRTSRETRAATSSR